MTRSTLNLTCGVALKGLNVAYAAIEIVVVHTYIHIGLENKFKKYVKHVYII